jgi:hypothetical protein
MLARSMPEDLVRSSSSERHSKKVQRTLNAECVRSDAASQATTRIVVRILRVQL